MKLSIKGMELELDKRIQWCYDVEFASWLLRKYPDKYVVGDTLSVMSKRVIQYLESEIKTYKPLSLSEIYKHRDTL